MRHTGPSMSPFNAWVLLKGLETLSLRVEQQAAHALARGRGARGAPQGHDGALPVAGVAPAARAGQARRCSAAAPSSPSSSTAARPRRFALMNALQVIDISNNLGDAKSLVTHPATTTHRRLERRGAAGRRHHRRRCVRISVGLEDPRDLIEDLQRALG